VALVGPPNAGKSTLFNALLGRVRAVATPVAGTTRDVLAEPLTIQRAGGEVEIELLDLPGLDAAASGLDALGQKAAMAALTDAQVVLHCCERGAFGPLPAEASRALVVRVRTKADRPGDVEGAEVAVCALTGGGLDGLRELIARAVTHGDARAPSGTVVARHARALRSAARSLASVDAQGPAEVAAHHLRTALDALGEVSGAVTPDDVIGLVFARFCVGK
jgi:tRNA modification GTPase